MKRFLCAVSVLAFMVPTVAAAQSRQNEGHRGQHADRQAHGSPNLQRPSRPAHPTTGSPNIQAIPNRGGHRPGSHSPAHDRPTTQPVPSHPGYRPPVENRPGHPSIQPVPNRPGHRPPHFRPIHRPGFHYPHGYHYRRWSIGLILPSIFLSHYYYFNDWSQYGVYPPPPGYVWVRYGPDLLLVNRYDGRIRDVIYGAFY